MLAIRCEFLQGTFQAAAPGRYVEAEWPPHPARLHAALLAAAFAIGRDGVDSRAAAALEWLEHQPPPSIVASESCGHRNAPTVFVPRNLTPRETGDVLTRAKRGENVSRQMGRVDRTFPTSVPGDAPVWIVWDSDPAEHRHTLELLASELQYLGSSRSPVCCDVVDGDPPARTLIPSGRPAATSLRVATPGFTAGLIEARHEFPPPTSGALVSYGPPALTEDRAGGTQAGPFRELLTLELGRRFPLDATHAATVSRAMRAALLARAGDGAPEVVHGHGSHPHVAFVPLPSVGHSDSSGAIVGVGIAIPARATDDEIDAIVTAARSVDYLAIGRLGRWELGPPDPRRALRSAEPGRWIGPSRLWATVTPVILDRHPKRRTAEALEDAVRETLDNALLPEPSALDVSPVPWIGGAPHAGAFRGNEVPVGVRVHLRLSFDQPVRGPLLAGKGRYFGVGLLAPVGGSSV